MKPNQKIKLLQLLPNPEELKDLMPAMNKPGMLKALVEGDVKKIANITLLAVLMGTVNQLMNENEDWEEYLDVSDFRSGEFNEETGEIPEPCGDPECKGCKELEEVLAEAKKTGAKIKVMKLTKAQAEEMGLDVTKSHDSAIQFVEGKDKVVH
jgi:hypothetical protein